jgi:hypothetical protein
LGGKQREGGGDIKKREIEFGPEDPSFFHSSVRLKTPCALMKIYISK